MGTSTSVAEFTLKLKRLPDALTGPQQLKVAKLGRDVTIHTLDQELRRIAPTRRLRGVGLRGAPVSVRSQQVNVGGDKRSEFVISAKGEWQFIENNTTAHFVVAKLIGKSRRRRNAAAQNAADFRTGSGGDIARGWLGAIQAREYTNRKGVAKTRRGAKALVIGGALRAYARHPGTHGQHPWRKGRQRAEKLAPKTMAAATVAEITKALR